MSGTAIRPAVRVLLGAVGLLLGVCTFLGARTRNPPVQVSLGEESPEFLGEAVPEVRFPALADTEGVLSTGEPHGRDRLIVFSDTGCSLCDELYPLLRQAGERLPVLIVAMGNRQQAQAKVKEHGLGVSVAFDSLLNSAGVLGVWQYPTVMLVSRDDVVKKAASGNLAARVVQDAMAEE